MVNKVDTSYRRERDGEELLSAEVELKKTAARIKEILRSVEPTGKNQERSTDFHKKYQEFQKKMNTTNLSSWTDQRGVKDLDEGELKILRRKKIYRN